MKWKQKTTQPRRRLGVLGLTCGADAPGRVMRSDPLCAGGGLLGGHVVCAYSGLIKTSFVILESLYKYGIGSIGYLKPASKYYW